MSDNSYKYIESYVHDNRVGVLVEFGMRTNITARVPEVKTLMANVALHIAACDPVNVDELFSEAFVKNPDKNISDLLSEVSDSVSDKITVTRFVRWDTEENKPSPNNPPSEPASNVVLIRGAR